MSQAQKPCDLPANHISFRSSLPPLLAAILVGYLWGKPGRKCPISNFQPQKAQVNPKRLYLDIRHSIFCGSIFIPALLLPFGGRSGQKISYKDSLAERGPGGMRSRGPKNAYVSAIPPLRGVRGVTQQVFSLRGFRGGSPFAVALLRRTGQPLSYFSAHLNESIIAGRST